MLTISKKSEGKTEIISAEGEIDASSSIKMDEAMASLLDRKINKVIVDLAKLEYISSAGLGVFMSYIEPFKEAKISFVLCNLSDKIKDVFEVLGLDQLIPIKSNLTEAKEELNDTSI